MKILFKFVMALAYAVTFFIIAGLLLFMAVKNNWIPSEHDAQFTEKLLHELKENNGTVSIATLAPHDFFDVCTVSPYTSPSQILSSHGIEPRKIHPSDRRLGENFWGILFVGKEVSTFYKIHIEDLEAPAEAICHSSQKAYIKVNPNATKWHDMNTTIAVTKE